MGETNTDELTVVRLVQSKPLFKEVIRYDGNNLSSIVEWSNNHVALLANGDVGVMTNHGLVNLHIDDFVIKGVIGEFYPMDTKVYRETFDDPLMERIRHGSDRRTGD